MNDSVKYFIRINKKDNKAIIDRALWYEVDEYLTLNDKEGRPYTFSDYDSAFDFMFKNVKKEMISSHDPRVKNDLIREKFLKNLDV